MVGTRKKTAATAAGADDVDRFLQQFVQLVRKQQTPEKPIKANRLSKAFAKAVNALHDASDIKTTLQANLPAYTQQLVTALTSVDSQSNKGRKTKQTPQGTQQRSTKRARADTASEDNVKDTQNDDHDGHGPAAAMLTAADVDAAVNAAVNAGDTHAMTALRTVCIPPHARLYLNHPAAAVLHCTTRASLALTTLPAAVLALQPVLAVLQQQQQQQQQEEKQQQQDEEKQEKGKSTEKKAARGAHTRHDPISKESKFKQGKHLDRSGVAATGDNNGVDSQVHNPQQVLRQLLSLLSVRIVAAAAANDASQHPEDGQRHGGQLDFATLLRGGSSWSRMTDMLRDVWMMTAQVLPKEECTAWVSRSIKDVLPVLRTYNTHALPYLLRSLLALRVIDEGEGGEGGEGGDGGDEGNVLQHAAAAVGVVLDAVMVHGIQTHDWSTHYLPLLTLERTRVHTHTQLGHTLPSAAIQAHAATHTPPASVLGWLRRQQFSPAVFAALGALQGGPQALAHHLLHTTSMSDMRALAHAWLDTTLSHSHHAADGVTTTPPTEAGGAAGEAVLQQESLLTGPLFYMSKEGDAGVFAGVSSDEEDDEEHVGGEEEEMSSEEE